MAADSSTKKLLATKRLSFLLLLLVNLAESESDSSLGRNSSSTTATVTAPADTAASAAGNNHSSMFHSPPSHFYIAAHIQTNLRTGISYFLPLSSSSFAHLPFLECGAGGLTTLKLPLVNGMFRTVPYCGTVTASTKKKKKKMVIRSDADLEEQRLEDVNFEERQHVLDPSTLEEMGENHEIQRENNLFNDSYMFYNKIHQGEHHQQQQPSKKQPVSRYVVALSPMQITVGGEIDGNTTTKIFHAGDIVFIEDTWRGFWNEEANDDENIYEDHEDSQNTQNKMKGYIMQPTPESKQDLNVLILTVPTAIHRHWKNVQQKSNLLIQQLQQHQQQQQQDLTLKYPTLQEQQHQRKPWWKLRTRHNRYLHAAHPLHNLLPRPCTLESDPSFPHASSSTSTTLTQHFTQHFVKLIQRYTHPIPSSSVLSSYFQFDFQDIFLPILAQSVAAIMGTGIALALVIKLSKIVPAPKARLFGAACFIGFGTCGFVWLGEEIGDEWENWKEKKTLERHIIQRWHGKNKKNEEEGQ